MKTAVVAGASGMIGSELCRQLAREDSGFDRVVALTRRPLDLSFEKVVEQRAELGRLDVLADIGPFDAAFCTLGSTIKVAGSREAFRLVDYDYVVAFARFAKGAGAKTLVLLTSVDSNPKSPNFYLQVKGEAELAVEGVGFESVYFMRPSFLMGVRREVRTGERIGITVTKVVQFGLVGVLRKYRPIRAEMVAGGMVGAALESTRGRRVCHYDEIVGLSPVGQVR
jgi:uncharacterized protein YbjT (DUF2867 family)